MAQKVISFTHNFTQGRTRRRGRVQLSVAVSVPMVFECRSGASGAHESRGAQYRASELKSVVAFVRFALRSPRSRSMSATMLTDADLVDYEEDEGTTEDAV